MSGTQTAGFDLVMQFSEEAYTDLLGVFFDGSGLIGDLINLIPGFSAGPEFTLSLSLDRPTDVALTPPGAENPLDLRLGFGKAGKDRSMRIVVGLNVDRSNAKRDTVQVDFKHSIYYAEVRRDNGAVVAIPNLVQHLQDLLPAVPVLPVPVDRSSTDPAKTVRADFRIIDDTSPADRDATAAMLTFGGSGGGNASAMQSFIPDGSRGGIGIYFNWLCRLAVPKLEEKLGLPANSFTLAPDRCTLNQTIRVDQDEEVDLTSMTLSLEDGFINISAHVTKSGFCYDASGDVSAKLKLAIENGRLIASVEVGDPNVDVDIPWYCYLAGAVIGAAIGGILLGIIGAIVGAILVPLIMWLASDVVESTINSIADRIVDAINEAIPDIDVPAFGVRILFQDVFIDDVVLKASMEVDDHSPVRSAGSLLVHSGQGVDLDNGRIVAATSAEADVKWLGRGVQRVLQTGCQAGIAHTSNRSFDGVARYTVYGYDYTTRTSISVWELGVPNPLSFLIHDDVFETLRVYAVRTNEGRYALIQAQQIDGSDWVSLRYKVWETNHPVVSIVGEFQCVGGLNAPRDAVAKFEPTLVAALPGTDLSTGSPAVNACVAAQLVKVTATPTRVNTKSNANAVLTPAVKAVAPRVFPVTAIYAGRWLAEVAAVQVAQAKLNAVTGGTRGKVQTIWSIGGTRLDDGSSGKLDVFGTSLHYQVKGPALVISVPPTAPVDVFVEVEIVDDGGCSARSARCVQFSGRCAKRVQVTPSWRDFIALQQLPASVVASGLVTTTPVKTAPSPRDPAVIG